MVKTELNIYQAGVLTFPAEKQATLRRSESSQILQLPPPLN